MLACRTLIYITYYHIYLFVQVKNPIFAVVKN